MRERNRHLTGIVVCLAIMALLMWSPAAVRAVPDEIVPLRSPPDRPAPTDSGFSIAPARLEVSVSERGGHAPVYITSYFDGELAVGTEGLPFLIEPETIAVTRGDRDRRIELTVSGSPEVAPGDYPGKLTFLAYAGKNLAYGVKVQVVVKKEGSRGFVAGLIDRLDGGGTNGAGLDYVFFAVAGAAVLAALAAGTFIGRRMRKPAKAPPQADDVPRRDDTGKEGNE